MEDDIHYMVAGIDGKVAENLSPYRGKDHIALVVGLEMTMHDDYQDMDIGSALMTAVMDMADNRLNLKRSELDFYVDTQRAIQRYEPLRFVIEGTRKLSSFREDEHVYVHAKGLVRE